MERCLQCATRSTETCFVDSRGLGAPRAARKWSILISSYQSCQRHQPDYPDANRGVAICVRWLDPSLVTAQTSNRDATDVWTRPIPPSPDLWEIRTLGVKWRLEVSWRRERTDRNVATWAKNDLVISFAEWKDCDGPFIFNMRLNLAFSSPQSEMRLCFKFHALELVISSDLLE